MNTESLRKRVQEIEEGLEPQTVTVRLRSGAERELTWDDAMQAMRDAINDDDSELIKEIKEIEAYKDDSGGLMPWLTIARVIESSTQAIKREKEQADAQTD